MLCTNILILSRRQSFILFFKKFTSDKFLQLKFYEYKWSISEKNKFQQSFNNIQRILVVADFLNLNFDRNLNLHCNVYTLKDHFISVLISIVARGQLWQKSGKKIMTARSTLCRDLNVAAGVAAIWQHEGENWMTGLGEDVLFAGVPYVHFS